MEILIAKLRQDYPALTFQRSQQASWSPRKRQITFTTGTSNDSTHAFAVLHELGHALLGHASFRTDIDLLKKELAAWEKAKKVAINYNITIHESHIQDCLDTYRDWLFKRSTCPTCHAHGVQKTISTYHCVNCSEIWSVSRERFCRPYRTVQPAK